MGGMVSAFPSASGWSEAKKVGFQLKSDVEKYLCEAGRESSSSDKSFWVPKSTKGVLPEMLKLSSESKIYFLLTEGLELRGGNEKAVNDPAGGYPHVT